MEIPFMLPRLLSLVVFAPLLSMASSLPIDITTNVWTLGKVDTIETISFVLAQDIVVNGHTLDDSFWLAQDTVDLNGNFGNDVWALGMTARLTGTFRDHARIAAQSVIVDGTVSNGLWAIAGSISATTNSPSLRRSIFLQRPTFAARAYRRQRLRQGQRHHHRRHHRRRRAPRG
jgi:hypothetical protein